MPDNLFNWPIVGNNNVVWFLQQNIRTKKVSHAYLFDGPPSVGKSTVAANFVLSLVCKNIHESQQLLPCHKCPCCIQVKNRVHPDVTWIEREVDDKTGKEKKNISIEQIRELKNKLSLRAFLDSYKIAVICDAETLSQEAVNALLKTLEEPSPNTVIIVISNNINLLPQTIISRCQVLKFRPVADKEILSFLISSGCKPKEAKNIASLACGLPGQAVNFFNDEDFLDEYNQNVKGFLNILGADIDKRFAYAAELINEVELANLPSLISLWIKVLRDILLTFNNYNYSVFHQNFIDDFQKIRESYSVNKIVSFIQEAYVAKKYLAANVNPKLVLENLFLTF